MSGWISSPDVRYMVDYSRNLLFSTLDALDGEKTIVWDPPLMSLVNLFCGKTEIDSHGVVCHINLEREQEHSLNSQQVVFFLSPTLQSVNALCKYLDKSKDDQNCLYYVYFIPEGWYVAREKLKEKSNGMYWNKLECVHEIPLWWLPRDGFFLSLSQPQLPSRLLINGDLTHLHKCALAINQIIDLCSGKIPVYSKGKWSNGIARMLQNMRNSGDYQPSSSGNLSLNRIVIIDRWLDPLTPLLHQLTFCGLLDEIYGIGMKGSIKVAKSDFEETTDGDPFDLREIPLNDELFSRYKDVHALNMGNEIAAVTEEIRKSRNYDREKMSIAEYSVLVRKLPDMIKKQSSHEVYIRLAEMVQCHLDDHIRDDVKLEKDLLENSDGDKLNPTIEEAIIDGQDLTSVLRLLCVHSLTASGFKTSVITQYRRLIMQSYGSEALSKVLKLQKMGLLKEKGGSGKMNCDYGQYLYSQMQKQYNLIWPDANEKDSKHPAYAYSGYCSLLVRILEEGDRLKWAAWNKSGEHGGGDDDQTAVFVIGGATRSEIALLHQIPNVKLVLTTSAITADKLLNNITNI